MMYAWRIGTPASCKADLNNRINAKDHQGEKAVCPLCDGEVVSKKLKSVWQWVHTKRCSLRRKRG